jgi:hypothetical protein
MLKHGGEIPLDAIPAVDTTENGAVLHVGFAPPQLLPGVGGGVDEVTQI